MWINSDDFQFQTEVPAKWVLTGEHSVLRGGTSLAFPFPRFSLKLSYRKNDQFKVNPDGFENELRALLLRSLRFLGVSEDLFSTGEIGITSSIPVGSGLGSSAALCVSIARLVLWKAGADPEQLIPLATYLEDHFHGKSSGMDIHVISMGMPIQFSMKSGAMALPVHEFEPRFEIQDTGVRSSTRTCIEKVSKWREQNPSLAETFDHQMQKASQLAASGLLLFGEESDAGEVLLKQAMDLAQNCFETWGLVTPELLIQKSDLIRQGALSVKLTGAGLGGFWVALWPKKKDLA